MTDDRESVFGLRLPPDLRDKLRQAADTSGRSLTKEILLRIEGSFDHDESDIVARVEALEELMRELKPLIDQSRATRRNRPK